MNNQSSTGAPSGSPQRRARQRPVYELLRIIGVEQSALVFDRQIIDAYKAGLISELEGRALQQFQRQSPRGRKRAALTPPSLKKVQALKTQLGELQAELEARYPSHSPNGDKPQG